jgi:hypothetical protein
MVLFVVNRGDNPLCTVYKKISGKNFGKLGNIFLGKKVSTPYISENVKKKFWKKFEKLG